MGSSTGARHERQEESSNPRVEGSNPATINFFCWIYLLYPQYNSGRSARMIYFRETSIVNNCQGDRSETNSLEHEYFCSLFVVMLYWFQLTPPSPKVNWCTNKSGVKDPSINTCPDSWDGKTWHCKHKNKRYSPWIKGSIPVSRAKWIQ